jgi:methyl-accepting chemotaxis protein
MYCERIDDTFAQEGAHKNRKIAWRTSLNIYLKGASMKIWFKVIVAPIVAMGFLILLGAMSYYALLRQQTVLDDLRENRFVAYRTAATGDANLADVHSGVYRLFTWIGNMDEKKIQETLEALQLRLTEVQKGLQIMGTLPKVTEDDRKKLDALSTNIIKYNQQISAAVDLATVDVSTGMAAMQTADYTYQTLRKEFRTQVESVQRNAEKNFADADELVHNAVSVSLGILWLALFGSAFTALIVARQIARPLKDAVSVAEAMSNGDLTTKIEVRSRDETGMLLTAMQNMVNKLSSIINEVRTSADNLSSASAEVSSTAQSLSQASSEQAASVEETSASMEQMSASINQNTENAKITEGIAARVAKEAIDGGYAVRKTVTAMQQITKKIGIIDDIAYQTNLLALNAAIEAARAGEHGKGFAVVASEVRKLAERSQVAAQEIDEVASGSVELAEQAGKLLDKIVPAINMTSDHVQEITAASEEQSLGIHQIDTAMAQLNHITQQNAAASEELAATAEEMNSHAKQLQLAMGFFKI